MALALRLHNLGEQSLWWDEGFSANIAQQPSLASWKAENHPPFYYAMLAAWDRISDGDTWLRMLSVLFGVGSVPLVYSMGRKMFGARAGLLAAGYLAVLSLHVSQSRQVRMYALLVFLFAAALWGLVVATRERRRLGWVVYATAASLLAYTHGAGVLYVAALALLFPLLPRDVRRRSDWVAWVLANGAAAALFLPWLAVSLARTRVVAASNWIPVPKWSDPALVLQDVALDAIPAPGAILQHISGSASALDLPGWLWLAPVVVVLAWAIFAAPKRNQWAIRLLLAAYVLPIALVFGVSLMITPIFLARVLLPVTIPLVLLLGSAAEIPMRRPAAGWIAHGVLLLLFLVNTMYRLRYPSQAEDWRAASQYLQRAAGPGEILVFNESSWGQDLINRYDRDRVLRANERVVLQQVLTACDRAIATDSCLDAMAARYPAGTVIWIVSAHQRRRTRDAIEAWTRRTLHVTLSQEFPGVHVRRALLR